MDAIEIGVVVVGLGLLTFVLWYFFGERRGVTAQTNQRGVQEIKIMVRGGYSPDVIEARLGVPVQLDFYRDETSSCSEQVIIADFGIARTLPAYKTTSIEFTPNKTGEFSFTCGMNMLHGKLIIK